MRIFSNPYTGQLFDFDAIEGVQVGMDGKEPIVAKFCPVTGKPLNHAAVDAYSYAGPESDRETWAKDAHELVDRVLAQVNESNAATLGVTAPTPDLSHLATKAELSAAVNPQPTV